MFIRSILLSLVCRKNTFYFQYDLIAMKSRVSSGYELFTRDKVLMIAKLGSLYWHHRTWPGKAALASGSDRHWSVVTGGD